MTTNMLYHKAWGLKYIPVRHNEEKGRNQNRA